ncbi:PREDICTED: dual specificity protein phosphatase 1-like isoform 1 [Fragaria vesca subsp. vesca]
MNQVDDSFRNQLQKFCNMNDRFSPCQIEEGLFLGSIGAANNKDELKKLNLTHIDSS